MADEKFEQLVEELNNLSTTDAEIFLNEENLERLQQFKLYLDDLYYNTGDSTLEDIKYDLVKDVLQKRDPDYVPKVGAKLRVGENRVKLPFWLGSADKIVPESKELDKWLVKNKASSYVISDKLDGVSCLFEFKNGKTRLYTRGDGEIGADISYLANYFKLPKLQDSIFVRGELILTKKIFETKYKNKVINGRQYKNPRNMVAGLIGGKTAREGLKDIDFVVYEIVGDSMPKPSEQLKQLTGLGFNVVYYEILSSISVEKLKTTLIRRRKESDYEIDGIIGQTNLPYDRNTSGNPDYLFAFKMLSDVHQTTVEKVEWNISKWGQIKPVVIVEEINAGGITMKRATAHNAKYVLENKLGPGAVIKITRSKEVIPYIVEVVHQAEEPQMPDIPYSWDKNNVNIIIKDADEIMCIRFLSDFFKHLGIKHVSEATVSKMFNNKLNNLLKIVGASKQRLLQVPEFQERSAERIFTNIHEGLQNVKLALLLGASGILGYGIGVKRIESLLRAIPDLLTVYKTKTEKQNMEMVMAVDGFSEITATKIVSNLKFAELFLKKMAPYTTVREEKRVSDKMQGQKIVMTGFRSKEMEDKIIAMGGQVVGSVSKNTTILVIKEKKDDKLSNKEMKAQELGIKIYSREEFEKILEDRVGVDKPLEEKVGKFYAVKVGRRPGIYSTWAECQKQILGFSGAKFKSFTSRKEAEEFIRIKNEVEMPSSATTVYFDGGAKDGRAGGATYIPSKQIVYFQRAIPDPITKKETNSRGELTGLILALTHTDGPLIVYGDNQYVLDVGAGINNEKANLDLVDKVRQLVKNRNILWKWVKGHSGDPGNDVVDRYATKALNLNTRVVQTEQI